MNKKISILYSGGGTLGPATPLLAIHEILKEKFGGDYECQWFGMAGSAEKELVLQDGIPYREISAGKLRRYISIWNITDIFKIIAGFFQSLYLLRRIKPSLCISAGGHVSVPVHCAAAVLGIPTWIHQQDVQVGIANKIMSVFADKITVVFRGQLELFSSAKTEQLGNPIRKSLIPIDKLEARKFFGIPENIPVVLAMGGGTGSARVNELVIESLPHLANVCHVIHLSGKERRQDRILRAESAYNEFYHPFLFLDKEMNYAYSAADLVICRGGFGTLSELAAFRKPAIIVPKPGHQVENAAFISGLGAAFMVNENSADGNFLAKTIKELLSRPYDLREFSEKLHTVLPPAEPERVAGIVGELILQATD